VLADWSAAPRPDWTEHVDPETDDKYYYNHKTQVCACAWRSVAWRGGTRNSRARAPSQETSWKRPRYYTVRP
jgi:hypothetical protein